MSGAPIAWVIAGSDSSGGSGIQADAKTMSAFGVHAMTAVTSITAQSRARSFTKREVSVEELRAQLEALACEKPAAVKVGMLGSAELIREAARALRAVNAPVVLDPVLVASSGMRLLDENALDGLKRELLPRVSLLTPNLPEAEALLGRAVAGPAEIEKAAHELMELGARSVLIKGGHAGDALAQDFWTNGSESAWLSSPRAALRARGTGCTLSSAIAAALARGFEELDAVVIGKAFLNQALRLSQSEASPAFLRYAPWPCKGVDLPWLTRDAESARRRYEFPLLERHELGFYPIVDRARWLERLLPQGVRTVQLRIKDLRGRELEEEIQRAVSIARDHGCMLFVNDHWDLALRHGAFGVHLGQEDLETADLARLERARIHLGVSTHCFSEVARALAVRPSYIAIGPIFPTTLKAMRFAPQGVSALRQWRALLDYPLVAIGGIQLERALDILDAGADSIAVVSDVTAYPDPEARARAWEELMRRVVGRVAGRVGDR